MATDRDSVDEFVRRIAEAVDPVRIVLFGSAARGDGGPHSDVDVLVVVPNGTHRRRTAQDLYQQLRGVPFAFDIVVATPEDLEKHGANPGLIYQSILAEGRTVYGT